MLVALPQVEETFGDTGLLKSTTTMNQEHIMSIIGLVLDMGDKPILTKNGSRQARGVSRGIM